MRVLILLIICVLLTSMKIEGAEKVEGVSQKKVEYAQETEVTKAIKFLEDHPDREYIRFFTFYGVPGNQLISLDANTKISLKVLMFKELCFTIHSLSYESIIALPQRVPNQNGIDNNTLYYIDIRNYGWSRDAWEFMSATDSFFREPIISPKLADKLRVLSANSIVRADWFIYYANDNTKTVDVNKDATPFSYVLLYSQVGVPKNVAQFRAAWFVDTDKLENKLKILKGTVVDYRESEVARHNRQLARARTELGAYYETSDVLNNQKDRDYVENLEAGKFARDVRDAGEMITHNKLGLQVYFLTNGQGVRVETADNGIATDKKDPDDRRVRMQRSCVICHVEGLNLAEPALDFIDQETVKLKDYDLENKKNLEAFYFSEFNEFVKEDRQIYAKAIQKITGMDVLTHNVSFIKVMEWYEQSVTLEQAALECGTTVEVLTEKLDKNTSGQVGKLFTGKTIPRETWDADTYTSVMLDLKALPVEDIKKYICIIYECDVMLGTKKLGRAMVGEKYEIFGEQDGWFKVKYKGNLGYIYKDNLEAVR